MSAAALRASLAVFDEGALVALANVGLYRRAARDVAEARVVLVEMTGERATVEVDGQRVTIDARGPKAATCGCTAPGVCRHRIAATLLLQTVEAGTAAPPEAAPAFDPLALLTDLDPAAVERWAGKAAWRAALEIAGGAAVVGIEDAALTVAFGDPHPVVYLLQGQGIDGIVSKARDPRQKPLHAAAVMAARRHFGLAELDIPSDTPAPVPAPAPAPAAAAAAAAATATATAAAEPQPLPDPAFLGRIEAALHDGAMFAFNLAPEPVEEQLFALSVASRAGALPRLGGLLRSLAAQMRLQRHRAFTFDPDRCLETLATAHALVRAVAAVNPATDDRRRRDLFGTQRQAFVPAGPLRLVGCGADQWRTDAGARGVTGIFHDPAGDRWLTFSHARAPGQDPYFDPARAHAATAIWGGVTLAQLGGATLVLEGAEVSEAGRLSNPAAATARIEPGSLPRGDWPARLDDWSALAARLATRAGLGLAQRADADFAILAPQRVAPPYFDDLAQNLIWPVEDGNGQWLALAVAHGDGTAAAMIERIESLGRRGWRGDILVRATHAVDRLLLSPIAIFDADKPLSLGLDALALEGRADRSWGNAWLKLAAPLQRRAVEFGPAPAEPTAAALGSTWQRLLDLAVAGLDRARPATLDALARSAATLDAYGCPHLAGRLTALVQAPRSRFLVTAYAVLTARRQHARPQFLRPLPRR